jgi:hypothetical protein
MRNLRNRFFMAVGLMATTAGYDARLEAGVTTYTSSAAFESAIAGYSTSIENYAGFTNNTKISAGQTFNGLTYTAFTAGPSGDLLGGSVQPVRLLVPRRTAKSRDPLVVSPGLIALCAPTSRVRISRQHRSAFDDSSRFRCTTALRNHSSASSGSNSSPLGHVDSRHPSLNVSADVKRSDADR